MNNLSHELDRILDVLQKAKSICIVGHVLPDGDCIGSELAMAMALKNLGKEVFCWNQDDVPEKLEFLDEENLMRKPRRGCSFDVVLALDCASFERMGTASSRITNRKCFINIDHHDSNTHYADLNWVVGESSSTGELVFQLIQRAGWEITPQIANCLFTAISTDTGSFQYRGTTPQTFAAAGKLLESGADVVSVCSEVYQSYPLARLKLLRQVLNRFKLTEDNKIAYYWLSPVDFARSGAEREDAEGLIDHIRAIDPVVVAIQFEEVSPNVIRVCMRSKNPLVDVGEVAGMFNGGGHKWASGAVIEGTRLSVQRRVVKAVRVILRNLKKRKKEKDQP